MSRQSIQSMMTFLIDHLIDLSILFTHSIPTLLSTHASTNWDVAASCRGSENNGILASTHPTLAALLLLTTHCGTHSVYDDKPHILFDFLSSVLLRATTNFLIASKESRKHWSLRNLFSSCFLVAARFQSCTALSLHLLLSCTIFISLSLLLQNGLLTLQRNLLSACYGIAP